MILLTFHFYCVCFCLFLTAISNIIKALSNQTLSSGTRRCTATCWKGVYSVLWKLQGINALVSGLLDLCICFAQHSTYCKNLLQFDPSTSIPPVWYISWNCYIVCFSDICKRSLSNYSDYAEEELSAKTNHEVSIQLEN